MRFGMITSLFLFAGCLANPSNAQEGCRPTASSCTQLYQNCEALCQKNSNNPGACIGRTCATPLTECKGTGVWRSRATSSAC